MIRIILFASFSFFFLITDAHTQSGNKPVPKILTATVYSNGKTTIGGVNYSVSSLATGLNRKMWNNYLATGKLYDSINIKMVGNVLMDVRNSVLYAIIAGLQKTLNDLSQKIYNASFDNLDPAKQNALRKQFPVIFQDLEW